MDEIDNFVRKMSTDTFKKLGFLYVKHKSSMSKNVGLRRFKSFFGITPDMCALVWREIISFAPNAAKPKHLLWCLFYLKQYNVEHSRRALFNSDEKTIRKWTWIFVDLIANINVVILEINLSWKISYIEIHFKNRLSGKRDLKAQFEVRLVFVQ